MKIRPNFFIVGAPKSGTTSLYHYLDEHPDVFLTNPKEVNHFTAFELENQNMYYSAKRYANINEYQNLFKGGENKKIIGEASVSYLFYPKIAERIYEYNQEAKILILLRNPVQRAFSHYLMDKRLAVINYSFENVIHKEVADKQLNNYYQQYVELGLYYNQVKRYLDVFGRDKVKIYLLEDLKDISQVVKDLLSFLDITDNVDLNVDRNYNSYKDAKNSFVRSLYSIEFIRGILSKVFNEKMKEAITNIFFESKKPPEILDNTKKYLQDLYRDDIIKLEALIGRNLKDWLL